MNAQLDTMKVAEKINTISTTIYKYHGRFVENKNGVFWFKFTSMTFLRICEIVLKYNNINTTVNGSYLCGVII